MANKNSTYVQSLVSFLLDTKPFHSKLTEIVEEYQLGDAATVSIAERLFFGINKKSAWLYPYFSAGPGSSVLTVPVHDVQAIHTFGTTPNYSVGNPGRYKVGRDESTDIGGLPFAYAPAHCTEDGVKDVKIHKSAQVSRTLLEGHDYFISHGAYEFQIKRTKNQNTNGSFIKTFTDADAPFPKTVDVGFTSQEFFIIGPAEKVDDSHVSVTGTGTVRVFGVSDTANYSPTFNEVRNENLIASVTSSTQDFALSDDPQSAKSRITALLQLIQTQLLSFPNASATVELNKLFALLAMPSLPGTYDGLLNTLVSGATPCISGFAGWKYDGGADKNFVDQKFLEYSPGLYFNQYTDLSQYEDGALWYDDLVVPGIFSVTNVVPNVDRSEYEEWTLNAVSEDTLFVYGSKTGFMGSVVLGNTFTSTAINFSTSATGLLTVGDTFVLTPGAKITVHTDAELERWALVKVNALSYSRPLFTAGTPRFGYIESQDGVRNFITVVNQSIVNQVLTFTAVSSQAFVVTSSVSGYTATIPVDVLFSDSEIALKIVSGTVPFSVGDVFFVNVVNNPPEVQDLDLYFGFDMGPYDAANEVYNYSSSAAADYLRNIDNTFDSRFTSYDLSSFNLAITNTTEAKEWRLRAVPDIARPLLPTENVDLLDPLLVKAASTVNLSLNGLQTVDGVSLLRGDLVLVKNQTTPTNNGVYVVRNANWQRLSTYDQTSQDVIRVLNGTVNTSTMWKRDFSADYLYQVTTSLYDSANNTTAEGPWSGTDLDASVDIKAYYAAGFALEFLENGADSWTTVEPLLTVGSSYSSSEHGISFTIVPASKPFISTKVFSTWMTNTSGASSSYEYEGGDTIYFAVRNDPPVQVDPAYLVSENIPTLILHGDAFHDCTPAKWLLTFSSSSSYTLQGVYTTGLSSGSNVFGSPQVINITELKKSYRNGTHSLHWTVKEGAGFAAGDVITFETYETKPLFLVHGSLTGFTVPAEIDKWYWNGKIGFKIKSPAITVHENDVQLSGVTSWVTSFGTITLNRLRFDAVGSQYIVKSHVNGTWMLYRDGEIVDFGANSVSDRWVSVSLPTAIAGNEVTLKIISDVHELSTGHDLIILDGSPGKAPSAGDFVSIERTKSDKTNVSIKAVDSSHDLVLQDLAPITTDVRFVDHNANSGVPLENTSPETAILSGWLPTITKFYTDAEDSTFSDTSSTAKIFAASTGELVGTFENSVFTWDTTFHTKYLPLNAQCHVLTKSPGLDDTVQVNITEGIKLLIGSSGLDEGFLFSDTLNLTLEEQESKFISSTYGEAISLEVLDGPFVGFLPGYDNTPFDFEDGVDGYYDAGQAFTAYFYRAHFLAALPVRTEDQEMELQNLEGLLGPYLNGTVQNTDITFFTTAWEADPIINWTPVQTGFGVPAVGMGIHVSEQSTEGAGAAVQDYMFMTSAEPEAGLDSTGLDLQVLDQYQNYRGIISTSIPTSGLPGGGDTYAGFDAILVSNVRTIDVNYSSGTPSAVYVWYPTESAPVLVPTFTTVGTNAIRFSVPHNTEMKIIVV